MLVATGAKGFGTVFIICSLKEVAPAISWKTKEVFQALSPQLLWWPTWSPSSTVLLHNVLPLPNASEHEDACTHTTHIHTCWGCVLAGVEQWHRSRPYRCSAQGFLARSFEKNMIRLLHTVLTTDFNLGKISIFASDFELRHNLSLGLYFLICKKTGSMVPKCFTAEHAFPKEILLGATIYETKADLFLWSGTEPSSLWPSPTPRPWRNSESRCTRRSHRLLPALTFSDSTS